MPRPAYIVCSESGAVDRYSNLVSCHNILERIVVNLRSEGEPISTDQSPWLRMLLVAAWRSEPGDDEQTFQMETVVVLSHEDGSRQEKPLASDEFRFKSRMQRFVHHISMPPPPTPGMLIVVNRVRRHLTDGESAAWSSQEFEIEVQHKVREPQDTPAAAGSE